MSDPSSGRRSATLDAISPFFIVADVARSIAFYRDRLGFEVRFAEPGDPCFFAMLGRDAVQLLIKSDAEVAPLSNPARHRLMRWDAYIYTADPDAVAAECIARGTRFSEPLADTHDGLRGFELVDPDGYTLFIGRPR